MDGPTCFQHSDRPVEVIFTFYDRGQLIEVPMCYVCRCATSVAALVHEGIIKDPYEIVNVDEVMDDA